MADPTCAERIGEQLAGRLRDFETFAQVQSIPDDFTNDAEGEALLAQASRLGIEPANAGDVDPEELREAAQERAYEYPLHVSSRKVIRVDISTGGPGDWFEVFIGEEDGLGGEVERIVYHFADWFDHAERTLEGDEFKAAESFLEPFVEAATQKQ